MLRKTIPSLLSEGPQTLETLGSHPKPRYANFIVHKFKVARTRNPTKDIPTIRGHMTTVYYIAEHTDRAIRRFVEENFDIFIQLDFTQNNFLNSSFSVKTVRKMKAELDMIMAEGLNLITLDIAIKTGISCMNETTSREKRSKSPNWTRIRMIETCRGKLEKCV